MKPIKFKYQNITFAENQPEYTPLPALSIKGKEGFVIFCSKMNLFERIKVLFTGKVWVSLMTFNQPLTPSFLSVNRKHVFSVPKDKASKVSKRNRLKTVQL